jgi:hypothetical protein
MRTIRIFTVAMVLLLTTAAALIAASCGTSDDATSPTASASSQAATPSPDSPSPSPSVAESPAPTPEVSWAWIRTREYRDWESPPGWDRRRASDSPHGEAKIIYVDDAVAATAGSGDERFPAGATIVKEGYDAGELTIIAAMQRLPGKGWFFAEYRADGSVIEEGDNPPLCTQCHTGSQDGVLAFSLD